MPNSKTLRPTDSLRRNVTKRKGSDNKRENSKGKSRLRKMLNKTESTPRRRKLRRNIKGKKGKSKNKSESKSSRMTRIRRRKRKQPKRKSRSSKKRLS